MFRRIIAIIIIIASILAIVLFAMPRYRNTKVLRTEVAELEDALNKAAQLRSERARLLDTYNTMTEQDRARLMTLLPDSVDNVKLSIDIEQLAARHGLVLKDANVEEARNVVADAGLANQSLGTIEMNLSFLGSYDSFVNFLSDLERSLRIIDVQSIGFQTQQRRGEEVNDYYEFSLNVATYWLR